MEIRDCRVRSAACLRTRTHNTYACTHSVITAFWQSRDTSYSPRRPFIGEENHRKLNTRDNKGSVRMYTRLGALLPGVLHNTRTRTHT